jgi:hypothetical protein
MHLLLAPGISGGPNQKIRRHNFMSDKKNLSSDISVSYAFLVGGARLDSRSLRHHGMRRTHPFFSVETLNESNSPHQIVRSQYPSTLDYRHSSLIVGKLIVCFDVAASFGRSVAVVRRFRFLAKTPIPVVSKQRIASTNIPLLRERHSSFRKDGLKGAESVEPKNAHGDGCCRRGRCF